MLKNRYEKNEFITIISIVLMIFILFFGWFLFNKKICIYKRFSGVVYKENVIELLLNEKELKLFYKNTNMFIDDKLVKIKIRKVEKDVLKREGVYYNQVFLDIRTSDMYKVNDVIELSVMEKKISLINIFKIIWEGD